MNLLLTLGWDPDAGDQHLPALAADFQRISQVRTQLVEGGDDLQFFGERGGFGGFRPGRYEEPGGIPGWRGMPPVVPATVLAGFVCWSTNSVISTQSRLRNSKRPSMGSRSRGAEFECGASGVRYPSVVVLIS